MVGSVVSHLEGLRGKLLRSACVGGPVHAVRFRRGEEWFVGVGAGGIEILSISADAHIPTVDEAVLKRLPGCTVICAADRILVAAGVEDAVFGAIELIPPVSHL